MLSPSHTENGMDTPVTKGFLPLLYPHSYVIEKGVCYLVLCEAGFPKKLAFAYLEDLQAEFHEQHGKKVQSVSRPYSFIEFGEGDCTSSWLACALSAAWLTPSRLTTLPVCSFLTVISTWSAVLQGLRREVGLQTSEAPSSNLGKALCFYP